MQLFNHIALQTKPNQYTKMGRAPGRLNVYKQFL